MPKIRTQRTSGKGTILFARELRKNMTKAEVMLWGRLRRCAVEGCRFRRQHPIGPFIADFFCSEAGLIIELDGAVHDEEEQRQRDRLRDLAMEDHGLRMLRIKNREVFSDIEGVVSKIVQALKEIETPRSPSFSLSPSGGKGRG